MTDTATSTDQGRAMRDTGQQFRDTSAHRALVAAFRQWAEVAVEQAEKGHWGNVTSVSDAELVRLGRAGLDATNRHDRECEDQMDADREESGDDVTD